MSAPVRMPLGPVPLGRRGLVLGAVGVGALTLAGCGIHLEDDAPNLPLVPRRTPIGAETELLALLEGSRELAAVCARWTSGPHVALAPRLTAIHRQQAAVLAALLTDAHVPADLVAGPAPPATGTGAGVAPSAAVASPPAGTAATGTPLRSPSSRTPVTTAGVTRLEAASLADAPRLAAAPTPLLATVAATLAQRYAASFVLGGTAPHLGEAGATAPSDTPRSGSSGTASPSPSGRWPETDLVALLTSTRAAVYGFEVAAAQADPAGRALALRTLMTLAVLRSDQERALAGPVPPAVIGYPLPFPVTTPALARRFAVRLATDLRAAYGSRLGAAAQGQVPFLDLVRWLGQVEVVGHSWGATFVPLPGMTTP